VASLAVIVTLVGVEPGAVATSIYLSIMNDPRLLAKLNATFRWAAWRSQRRSST
jgi:hypothetical protein